MEPYGAPWLQPVAIGGKRVWRRSSGNRRTTVAVARDRLQKEAHGKEGVDGSSPSEGSAKVQHVGAFAFSPTCKVGSVRWVWSCLWSFRVQNGVAGRDAAPDHGPETQATMAGGAARSRVGVEGEAGARVPTGGSAGSWRSLILQKRPSRRRGKLAV
jgi:hypothetical protein